MEDKERQIETEEAVAESHEETAVPEGAQAEQAQAEEEGAPEDAAREAEDPAIAKLRSQLEEQQQRVLRVQADFDNFRRRTLREKDELAQYASVKLITQLLPVVDNFERAITASKVNSDYDSLAKGVEMIFRQLEQLLEAEGVTAIEAVGQPFNPEIHQAIMQVESEEYEEGIVVEEVQKGFQLKDRVLRPSMVKVSG